MYVFYMPCKTKMLKKLNKMNPSNVRANFHKKFWNRILRKHHRWRRVDKAINASNFLYRNWIHIGELVVALLLSFSTFIFGNGNSTPNNQELVYPLQEVSTLECRMDAWDTLSQNCKIQLPIIAWANYKNYINNSTYTDIYTVLYGWNYHSWWNINEWSHYWVDIATAKWTPVYAIADGKVYFAWEQAGYGNVVKIEFVFQWVRYFAIYGHLSAINVKEWDTVSKGQKIGAVGNSWVTMWAMGGYHVHFEIAKWDSWRPVYAFYGCTDLSKWGIEIINNWLCRTEMFSRTVDPIAFLEWAKAKLPHPVTVQVAEEHSSAEMEKIISAEDREYIVKIAKLYLWSPYQLGGTGTLPWTATDCSNFTKNVFQNVGITLERSAADQAYQFSAGGYWYDTLDMAEIWDLIFFKNTYISDQEITHVWIYVGNGMMIHAGTKKVDIVTIDSYWKEHFKWVGSFKYLHKNYNKQIAKNNYLKISSIPVSQQNVAKIDTPIDTIKNNEVKQETKEEVVQHEAAPELTSIKLEDTKLDETGKKFFNEWNIKIEGDVTTAIKKWETRVLKLIVNKDSGDKYNWVLKQPIMFVANSTNISIDPVVISLVKNGEVEIKIKAGQQAWDVFVAVNLGTNKMWGFTVKVQ